MSRHAPLDFSKQHAAGVIRVSPVSYIKGAKCCGSLFLTEDAARLRCGLDSNFFVDHTEPLEALARLKETGEWPLSDFCWTCRGGEVAALAAGELTGRRMCRTAPLKRREIWCEMSEKRTRCSTELSI